MQSADSLNTSKPYLWKTAENHILGPLSREEIIDKICQNPQENASVCQSTSYWIKITSQDEIVTLLEFCVLPLSKSPNEVTRTVELAQEKAPPPPPIKKYGFILKIAPLKIMTFVSILLIAAAVIWHFLKRS
jgi:hypothetical protein